MKSILVHLDASPRAAVRLDLAQRLANRHDAELNVLYGVLPSLLAGPWITGEGMMAAASALSELDKTQRDRARATYDAATGKAPMRWLESDGIPYTTLTQNALYADLLVLGQADSKDALSGALPPDLVAGAIIDTGKPTLVVPYAGTFDSLPSRILIAWKPTREAARAVSAALPWLRLASSVHIATRSEQGNALGADPGAAALKNWLAVQGVHAAIRTHEMGPGDVGEGLLSLAADTAAECLVMGCYGHGRTREWVLGGASRTILGSMTLPLLTVH
jgi:nucleotide-binding universal stress UspA family protein